MSISEIAEMMVQQAYANRADPSFFRTIEAEIINREDEIFDYRDVGKFLWAFSFSNLGSAIIYKKIADIIKIAYSEMKPTELAEYSKYFSKATES